MIQRYFTKEKRQEEFFSYFAKEGVRAGVFLILGFLFSNAILFKSLSPLGLGLIGVLNGLNLYSCVCGVILGHCLGASAGIVIKYIGATVISVFIKFPPFFFALPHKVGCTEDPGKTHLKNFQNERRNNL